MQRTLTLPLSPTNGEASCLRAYVNRSKQCKDFPPLHSETGED
jgi:hypothetical protein